ncbi:MmgE/PrpD family protein [Pseudaminobacter sp. 19-2017]|uniref:MmgE/PrpD family protein n=1 Tax=Pseudaminobacter soli (ex Zhang et al. 2022) TaxID=2831468 RepID=A0A942E6S0_9HYPH|nr:MmgE/PrpD family protein [Pseudaminobacter soli]MBS3649482.1 MmgE/PrpD family protein [Pseudaminobacter soli]
MSLTSELVSLIRNKPVGQSDLEAAALFVLDTLACALGGLDTGPARMLRAVAPPETGDVARRAFYLGGLSHILEMDDLHRDSVTHPGCVVIPAAWAITDDRNLGGVAFLKAVLAGYEACCRVGMSVGKAHYRVWHNTSTCGPFGSAMAVADLIGLSHERAVWALGNAGTQSSGLWQFLESGSMSKHLHTARGAESGVLAALLAAEGFTGAPDILEGAKGFYAGLCPDPLPDAITADPDRPWELTKTSIKPWPCCRHTHPTIDAAIELHGRLGRAEIVSVTVGAYQAALDVCDRPAPQDPYSAKFSLQHCVAIALADGRVDQTSFDATARARMAPERRKVTVLRSLAVDGAYPRSWGTDVRVETANGRVLEAARKEAKGDPENPVTASELSAKARMLLAGSGMPSAEADRLVAVVLDLPGDRPVRSLGLFPAAPHGEPPLRARSA